jgi:hypothetical protein
MLVWLGLYEVFHALLIRKLGDVPNTDQVYYQVLESILGNVDLSHYLVSRSSSSIPATSNEDIQVSLPQMQGFLNDAAVVLLALWFTDVARSESQDAEGSKSKKANVTRKSNDMLALIQSLSPWNSRESEAMRAFSSSTGRSVPMLSMSSLFPTALDSEQRRDYFSSECVQSRYRQLLGLRSLPALFNSMLVRILNMLHSPSPIVRAKAMKNLSRIVQVDSELINNDMIREAILERLNDIAISVREEVVKLIGAYLIKGDNVPDSYLDGILVRLRDKGVSVRKSVVNIIREVLLYQPHHQRYASLCLALLERRSIPKEEDSIRDIIQATFQTVWFLPPSEAVITSLTQAATDIKEEAASGTADDLFPGKETENSSSFMKSRLLNPFNNSENPEADHLQASCTQMLDVVDLLDNEDWLINLIREMLHGRSGGNETNKAVLQRRAVSEQHCKKLVDCLVEMLLKTEEDNSAIMSQIEGKRTKSLHVDLIIHTIALFSEVRVAIIWNELNYLSALCNMQQAHPPLVIPHLRTLVLYLKKHDGITAKEHESISMEIAHILTAAAEIENGTANLRFGASWIFMLHELKTFLAGSTKSVLICLPEFGGLPLKWSQRPSVAFRLSSATLPRRQ